MSEIEHESGPGLHQSLFKKESNLDKYRRMVIGDQGWLKWIYFELVILFFSLIPGALGLVCRKFFYRPMFKHVGKNVVFGRNLALRHPHKIVVGDNVIFDDECLLDAKGETNTGIRIGDYVTIGRFTSLVCKNGDIEIGPHVNIGSTVKIIVADQGKITFGSNIDVGSSCHFSAGSYDYSQPERLPSSQRLPTEGIIVDDFVWIGAGVIILDGVHIGRNSIIGAGAVVTQDIPPKSIASGVPAEVKRER